MNQSQILVLCVIFLPLFAVMAKRLRLDIAALIIATLLGILQYVGFGVLGPKSDPDISIRALSGFGRPAVLVLACLFILTGALEKSGFARWITKQILRMGGKSVSRLIFLFASSAALLSLFMNDVAVGALLIPSVLETYYRTEIKPSKLLIPVAFGSLLGGMATYFTTANIVISDVLVSVSPNKESLSFFSFFPTGGLIFLAVFGDRLLPEHESSSALGTRASTGSELEEIYELCERTWRATVQKDSTLVNHTLEDIGFGNKYGLTLVAIYQGKNMLSLPNPGYKINAGDQLLFIGREERVKKLVDLGVRIKLIEKETTLSKRGLAIFELLVAPRSNVVGKTLKILNFRQQYGLSVIALQRRNKSYRTDVGSLQLEIGDSLLVAGEISRRDNMRLNKEFLLLEPSLSDQPLVIKDTLISLGVLFGSVIATMMGVPIYLALLTAVIVLLVTGTLSIQGVYEAIEWQVIIIGCMFGISVALIETGLVDIAGERLMHLAFITGPLGLACGTFLISSIFAQIMGGQIAALIVGPIAISVALKYGVNLQAIAVATAIGCSNSFLTPMAHAVNLIMVSPGGYDFRDFFRIGRWLFLISFIMLLVGMMLFWQL